MSSHTALAILGGRPVRRKPFPVFPKAGRLEMAAVGAALRRGQWSGYVATPLHARLEDALAGLHGTRFAVLTSSGTAALEVALRACGVQPGDEVVVSPYTCLADPEAILRVGAVPIFGDIDPHTYGLDLARLDRWITPRTTCLIDVHFGGYLNDMDALHAYARRRGLVLIEDAALAHGAAWRGRPVGQWGQAACLSLGSDKLVTVGEGGCILTNDPEIARRCRLLRHDGRGFLDRRGRPFDYEWAFCRGRKVDQRFTLRTECLGWNYRMAEVLAALGLAQLRRYPAQQRRREANGQFLAAQLARIPWIRPLPRDPRQTAHPYSIFIGTLDGPLQRVRHAFLAALRAELTGGVSEGYHHPVYAALRAAGWHANRGRQRLPACPEAEKACRTCFWIWHNVLLGSAADMRDVVRAFQKVVDHLPALEKRAGAIRPPASPFGW